MRDAGAEIHATVSTAQAIDYQCGKCSYIYEPEAGDHTANVPPGTPWEALPQDWACPHCGASGTVFQVWKSSREPDSPV